jgi:hypothetical protein
MLGICLRRLNALAHLQVGIIRDLIGGGKASGNIVVLIISNVVLTCVFPMIAELDHDCKCDLSTYHPLWPGVKSWKPMQERFDPIPEQVSIPDALWAFFERIELFQPVIR